MFWINSAIDFFSFIPLSSANLDLKLFGEKLVNYALVYLN